MFFGKTKKEKAELVEKFSMYDNIARVYNNPSVMPGVRVFLNKEFVLEGGIFINIAVLKGIFKMHDKVLLDTPQGLIGPYEIAAITAAGIGTEDTCAPFECTLVFKDAEAASIVKKAAIVCMSKKTEAVL